MQRINVLPAILMLLMPLSAGAGELALGGVSFKGTTANVPIILKGDVGTGVAAMDFTFTYDPAVFEPVGVTAGEAASAADKGVQYNLLEPGRCKVVMMGLNQSVVPSGEVAMLRLRMLSTAGGSTELAINDPTFSDPNASSIPSKGTTETIELAANTTNPEEADPPEAETPEEGTPEEEGDPTAPAPGEVAPPGSLPDTPTDTTIPQAPGKNGLAGSKPVGSKAALGGNPVDPTLANRLKNMARIGDASQLPRGIQPGVADTPLGATPASAGAVNVQPGPNAETPEAPAGTTGVALKPGSPGAGVLAMNVPAVPGQGPIPGAKDATGSTSTSAPRNTSSALNPKWIGVAVIVLAMGVLFALRRRLFS